VRWPVRYPLGTPAQNAVTIAAACATIVLGINAFVDSVSSPSAPSATAVPLASATGPANLVVYVQTQVWSNQPPNTIDMIPIRLSYSAWVDGTLAALNASAPVSLLNSSGNLYTLGGEISISPPIPCGVPQCSGANYTLNLSLQAFMPIFYTLYSSAVSYYSFVFHENVTAPFVTLLAQPPGDPPSAGYFEWNAYGSLTAAVSVDLLAYGVVTGRLHWWLASTATASFLLVQYLAWVAT
jgi:hypothetical protein